MKKKYINSVFCSNVLFEQSGKVATKYCKNRWCMVCARIRTGQLINTYYPILKEWKNAAFLTLTMPTVSLTELKPRIIFMISEFAHIKDSLLKKRKIKLVGVRKLECTYNPVDDKYHPNFHYIDESYEHAELVRLAWLRRNESCNIDAQKIQICTENSVKELFKYFTKILSTKNADSPRHIYVSALDNIFGAMTAQRVYQPFGFKKLPNDLEIDEQSAEIAVTDRLWVWEDVDWIDKDTGELLTGYSPADEFKHLKENLKQLKK